MKLIEKSLMFLLPFGAMMVAITMQSGSARAQQASVAGQNDVTAIDILLDPDTTFCSISVLCAIAKTQALEKLHADPPGLWLRLRLIGFLGSFHVLRPDTLTRAKARM